VQVYQAYQSTRTPSVVSTGSAGRGTFNSVARGSSPPGFATCYQLNGPLAQRQSGRLLTGEVAVRIRGGLPCACSPTGRGNAPRRHPVGVQITPGTPSTRPFRSVAGRRAVYAVAGVRFSQGPPPTRRHQAPPSRKTNRPGRRRRLERVRHAQACGHRALSLPPLRKVNRTGVRHPFEAGGHRKVWGSRPRLSAIHRAACAGARTGSANKDALVPSPRRKRGPLGAGGSIPSASHHANVAQ
jgi:hypothetical protein